MSTWLYVFKSLFFHKRINFAIALGVAAATAVLTGALIVGDSMRTSLRSITLDRLGKIDEVLINDLYFREQLASELASQEEFKANYDQAVPLIFLPSSSADRTDKTGNVLERAGNVTVIGCNNSFWQLGSESLHGLPELKHDEIIINQQLADELGFDISAEDSENPQRIALQIAGAQAVSADSAIGKKEGTSQRIPRLKVVKVLPNKSIARFGLQPSQLLPNNAFISITLLQEILQQEDKVNAIFVAGKSNTTPPDESASEALRTALNPKLEDFGLLLRTSRRTFNSNGDNGENEAVAYEYQSLSSERMMLDPETDTVLSTVLADKKPTPVLTYLANQISRKSDTENEKKSIPFSMVTAIEFGDSFSLTDIDGNPITELNDDEIVLNSWSADDLGVKVGDQIELSFYEPETTHGNTVESKSEFTLKAIAKLVEPTSPYRRDRPAVYDQKPTFANDPDLTPFVPGVTDRASIENWELPFDTPGIRGKDDDYWKNYRTTPKAFITLSKGRQLWQSRFGATTSLRLPIEGTTSESITEHINQHSVKTGDTLGLVFTPVKRNGLNASSGSTPFDGLFLALSFFIIASAIILVALLFRLGVEQRANELGVLTAVGINRKQASRQMILEGIGVSIFGGLIGIAIGIGYAKLMLLGLTTVWVEAIVTPFLELFISWKSLIIGLFSGVIICVCTIAYTIRRTKFESVRSLLSGKLDEETEVQNAKRSWMMVAIIFSLLVAIVLSITAVFLPGGEAQAGAFVGSGFMLLTGLLLWVWRSLRDSDSKSTSVDKLSLGSIAFRNASRKPGRSTLTIGLVAIATFLIVAISSFHLSPTQKGTGGFNWVAQSDRAIYFDLNDAAQREKLLGTKPDDWPISTALAMRLRPGADASCNNPYQIHQPRVLGMPNSVSQSLGAQQDKQFAWAGSLASSAEEKKNPWLVLETELDDPDRVPVVIDKNTAMYSLKIFTVGQDFEMTFDDNQSVKFRVVGFLANSILQGNLIISERQFKQRFPSVSGYRYFLLDDENRENKSTVEQVEKSLSEYGFDMRNSNRLLESLLAVQNTYLKAFQSLGSLGLLLGTFGLATVQLRNVFERRSELALLSAVGFSKPRLAKLVLLEHVWLLFGGMLIGVLAALFAVLPHMFFGDASIPWLQLVVILTIITIVGLLAGLFAVRSSLNTPIVSTLRGE